jgi:hypothetical protein
LFSFGYLVGNTGSALNCLKLTQK